MSAKSKAILRIASAAEKEMSPTVKSIAKTLITDGGISPDIMPHEQIIAAHLLAEEPIKPATKLALEHMAKLNGPIQEGYTDSKGLGRYMKLRPAFAVSNKSLKQNDFINRQFFNKENKKYFPNVYGSYVNGKASHNRELYSLAIKKMGIGIDKKKFS